MIRSMNYNAPLVTGTLIKRYKRFLADVALDTGETITAHVANPGSMLGLADAGLRVWLEPNDDPKRKVKYAWRHAELPNGTLVCVDTGAANRVVKQALMHKQLNLPYDTFRPEVKYAENSRIDFLLSGPRDCYLEVKSVSLSRTPGLAEFPDSVTKRGTKHMHDLTAMVTQGHDAAILYLINRTDATSFALADDIDPEYAQSVHMAIKITPEGISVGKTIPLALKNQSD